MKDRILDKIIRFDMLLGVVALSIAIVAAFFSVYGIATLFAGAFISTVVMASVLEIGKIVSVTYLYRYWKQTKMWLSVYLSIALIVLMILTSLGIFGYLSSAYQKSSTAYKSQQNQIVMVEKTKTYAQNKIDQAQIRIIALNELRKAQESRMSDSINNVMISRNPIALKQIQDQTAEMIQGTELSVKLEQEKIEAGIKEVIEIEKKVSDMKYADNSKDIRTFEFVAELFHTDLDTVAKWFILSIIMVFDPLAIALILAYNVVTYRKPLESHLVVKTPSETVPAPTVESPVDEVKKKVVNHKITGSPLQKIPKIAPPSPPSPLITTPDAPYDTFSAGYFKQY
jgi:hypothetical protein